MNQENEGSAGAASPLAGKRAVVVEDEGVTQLQMRRALTQAGLVIAGVALNARDGVDLVLRERPDLVLMDVTMAGDIDGLDAAAAILATFRTCIVVITAYNNDERRWRAQSVGACAYIVKPVTTQSLIRELEHAFSAWTQSPGKSERDIVL